MKEFRAYQSLERDINSGQTESVEIRIYKDFYLSRLKLKIENVNPEDILLEIENYLPVTNFRLLFMENDGTYNYILPVPKLIKRQHLLFNISNLHPSLQGKVQIFLQGYEETDRNVDLNVFDQAKIKTVNNITVAPGKINTELVHIFDEDIFIENIVTYFTGGKEKDVLFNLRNEKTDQYLFREPVNFSFLNYFVDNVNGIFSPLFYQKGDSVRFFIQNLNPTDTQVFSFALHGREKRGS